MSVGIALEIEPDTEPEFGDGDGDNPHAACAEAFRNFLVLLTVRVSERNPAWGKTVEEEIAAMLDEHRQGESNDAP